MKITLIAFLVAAGFGVLAEIPPPTSTPPTPPAYDPSDIIYTSTSTNEAGVVKEVRVVQPPLPEPTQTTIRLKFHDKLNTNAIYTVDFTCPRSTAFAGWEIIEE